MTFEFKLADLGEGVQEGEIVRWLVERGAEVRPEQPLVEVMTDKVTAELPSPVAGTVTELRGEAGEIVPVGATLVVIETAEPATVAPASAETLATAAPPEPVNGAHGPLHVLQGAGDGLILAVPAVRRLARELGVALERVSGTGPGGRITEADVRAFAMPAQTPQPLSSNGSVRRIPLRGVRRAIAQHLVEGHVTTAPYTYVEEFDFTDLVRLRERVQPLAERAGSRLTYLPFLMAAVSMALKEHPELNATVDSSTGDLLVSDAHHLGVAVHTEEGLVVPVVRHVERRSLLDLAREVERLAASARAGGLTREDTAGGTFSLSSLGPLGGVMATPMLNTPQVAVLGVHRIAERPVVREGTVVVRQTANVSLTLDHRYIDGFVGAAFTATLKRCVEDPAVMLFWLAELREA